MYKFVDTRIISPVAVGYMTDKVYQSRGKFTFKAVEFKNRVSSTCSKIAGAGHQVVYRSLHYLIVIIS